MIDVAIIGAGSAGLVTARHLISAGLRPVLFEAAKTIGGAWTPASSSSSSSHPDVHHPPLSRDHHHHPASKMWNGMRTNLSKYTCQFTDFPWPDSSTSTFPTVQEMHDYLQSYADTFLHDNPASCEFLMQCRVTNIEQLNKGNTAAPLVPDNEQANYKVEWIDVDQTTHCRDFGGVIVASGFFHTPCMPSFLKDYTNTKKNESSTTGNNRRPPQIIHSSQYRTHHNFKTKNVAVIGGSFSSLEIAADVSKSAARVVNILPSIPWVIPRWIYKFHPSLLLSSSSSEESMVGNNDKNKQTITILPSDLQLYQRKQPFQGEVTELTPEMCRERHQYVQSLVGRKQRSSPMGEPTNWDEPTIIAISDEYVDLVNEEKIHVIQGRLVGIDDDGRLQIDTPCDETTDDHLLTDIDVVICATGYCPNLHSFLSSAILSTLDYDKEDKFSPLTLAYDTLHPSLPNLAFCGLYKGPYLGVMDLQARLAATLMSGSISIDEEAYKVALKTSETIRKSSPRQQFPHFYPDLMDTLAQVLNQGDSSECEGNFGIVVPPLYQKDESLREKCRLDLEREIKRGQDGSRMPKLVLNSILGSWSYDRKIVHLQTGKQEHVSGTVKYSKYWTRDCDGEDGDNKATPSMVENPVLYREDGVYEFSPTQKFDVFREYEYEVKDDALEIYFVEGGKRAHMFLSLKFVPTVEEGDGQWVKATSDHLCIKDLYSATFRVKLNGLSASEIIIKYRVKGPAKDYESTTILTPKVAAATDY
jgi:hypothetical protein